ncbi:SKI family transcriptional corepressor 2 [Hypsibius exemplaris]|uniref:SKI family transcriptional corepressor 2 n=1 Tax=Hypsibius exemplaris TaxID=2072580 RepID=A0A1W0XF16_HYPEX|nr:SKI family transcriptional corepressor 2 [Hypsibius exemplaris]
MTATPPNDDHLSKAEVDSDDHRHSRRSTSSPRYQDPPNTIHTVQLFDIPIVALNIDCRLRLCLAQISSTLLKAFSYNEIHNRRVALGINCVQCTPVQLEILRRAGAMPISSRRCGMITKREAERLVKSFLCDAKPPSLPDDFAFDVVHHCAWGCKGKFLPSRYNSSRAKCVQCVHCQQNFSPNKFIFHSHKLPESIFSPADAANFNSWRRHINLAIQGSTEQLIHAWEDVKAMFNGGSRRRMLVHSSASSSNTPTTSSTTTNSTPIRKHVRTRVPSPVRPIAPVQKVVTIHREANSNNNSHSSTVGGGQTAAAASALINYSSFMHPAASFLQYEWLYRHHQAAAAAGSMAPFSLPGASAWMQGALHQPVYDSWPWSTSTMHSGVGGAVGAFERKTDFMHIPDGAPGKDSD